MINALPPTPSVSSSFPQEESQSTAPSFTPVVKRAWNWKLIIGSLVLMISIIGGGVGLFLSGQTQELRQQASSCTGAGPCGPITCDNGQTVPQDACPAFGAYTSCDTWAREACAARGTSYGGGGGGGGNTTSCSGAGNARSCEGKNVGDNVPYDGGICTCTRTSGTLCGCVPAGGTTCEMSATDPINNVETPTGTNCINKGVGASCTRSGSTGTCTSAGIDVSGKLRCRCNLGGNQTFPEPGEKCTRDSDCVSGKFCSTTNTCVNKISNGNRCANSGQCLSGNCIDDGTGTKFCRATGQTTCVNDSSCAANRWCDAGTCRLKRDQGGDCTRNEVCKDGLSCISLRCRAPGSGGSCTNGQWTCGGAAGCGAGQGQLCSGGKLSGQCIKADACAPAVSGSCLDYPTSFSNGENDKGRFVACNGKQNCFCPHISGDPGSLFPGVAKIPGTNNNNQNVSPSCATDAGNDSCGAGPGPVAPSPVVTPPPTTTPIYSCNSACENNDQCKSADSRFICFNDPTDGKRCRLGTNTGSKSCRPAAGPQCLSIGLINTTVAGGVVTTADPKIGDEIRLLCGAVNGAARYRFRLYLPDGTRTNLNPAPDQSNPRLSDRFKIEQPGKYVGQCSFCTGSDPDTCSPYEDLP